MGRVFKTHLPELRRVFIVSQVNWLEGEQESTEEVVCRLTPSLEPVKLSVSVQKADGKKCERCWNYSVQVGAFLEHPTLCERCLEAIGT